MYAVLGFSKRDKIDLEGVLRIMKEGFPIRLQAIKAGVLPVRGPARHRTILLTL